MHIKFVLIKAMFDHSNGHYFLKWIKFARQNCNN